jgi:glycosyltransferase involved in cell wall biosynthesis
LRIALNAWFIDRPETGSGQYLAHLLAEYAARLAGHQFLLCVHAGQRPPEGSRLAHAPGSVGPAASRFEWRALPTPFDGLNSHLAKVWFEQSSFPRACRRWQADLIHVPYWASPLFAHAPTLVTIHDLITALLPAYTGGTLGRVYNGLVARSARRAACILTDSQASREDILRHLRVPAQRVRTILLAADERFRPVEDRSTLAGARARYELPPRYLLYLGGFDVRKNVPGILGAFARLDLPDLHLVIAGKLPDRDSDLFPNPRRIAGELGILDRVRFTGWIQDEDKPALYSGATAFLFPSYYEGFGLPVLEAMACGTPVVTSTHTSLPEIIGEGGLCVNPGDLDALAGAMRSLATDQILHEAKCRAALAQASRFSWRQTALETMAAYSDTLN